MILISKQTSDVLDELTGAFFDLNRTLDRCVSVMTNVWSMPQAADIVHHKLAHLMPLMADEVTEIKDRYNLSSVYPETHRDGRDYTDLRDMYETVLSEFEEVYQMMKLIKQTILSNDDFNVLVDLHRIVRQYNVIMGQIITLRDKAVQMPTCYDEFDRHIVSWGIDGLDLDSLRPVGTGEDD